MGEREASPHPMMLCLDVSLTYCEWCWGALGIEPGLSIMAFEVARATTNIALSNFFDHAG